MLHIARNGVGEEVLKSEEGELVEGSIGEAAPRALKLSPQQRMAASLLHRSQSETACVTVFGEIDVSHLVAFRKREEVGDPSRPGVLHFVMRAVVLALGRHPALNAHLRGNEITTFGSIDLGVAVALESGELVVPVLRNAQRMSVAQVAAQTRVMTERARSGSLTLADVRGATFTISSLATSPVPIWATPIVPVPQVAILAVTAIRERVVLLGDKAGVLQILPVSLAFDHRAINGAPVAAFLSTLAEMLADPAGLVQFPAD